jgi:hypothetical protein
MTAKTTDWALVLIRVRLVFLVLFGLVVVLQPVVLVLGFCGAFETPFRERGVADPAKDFSSVCHLPWPASARVVAAGDSHSDGGSGSLSGFGPGILDGTLYIVFDADPAVIAKWLSNAPPWGDAWKDGAVPDLIASNFKNEFTLPARVRYAALNRSTVGPSFWDGQLIAVDVQIGRVWLVKWDK